MTTSLILGCCWVIAATCVAMLPMRYQYAPGIVLLGLAPVLILWISWDYGIWVALLCVLGFVSMFRRPLVYLWQRYVRGNSTNSGGS